ncbi:MAG: type I restriction endonuclease subunit R, partial [Flavobacteriales bacterium]
MTTQPEALLESELVQQLHGLGYERVRIEDEAGILANLKRQLERFNQTSFSERDMTRILIHLGKGTIYDRAKTLRDRYALEREDGTVFYVRFFDGHTPGANLWQVTNQVTMHGSYENRYDVTVLVNGLPLVQVELKRRGLELKEAFNQILRYKRHSFWANSTLFQFVQLFVISNGVNTKYYVNNPLPSLTFKQTFYWAAEDNRIITDLTAFASAFLNPAHLGRMIGQYVVLTQAKLLMVLRPYQVYAVEAIVNKVASASRTSASATPPMPEVLEGGGGGYIWHTTGSGKTLTSFKASQVITDMPEVAKVVFVVDRKDLDYQTMREFNSFKEGSVDSTENTKGLVQQLGDDTKLIVTTIQKLNIAISKVKHEKKVQHLKDQRLVFIFDECHRSQFGQTHKAITDYFTNTQLFGFTGTPIFAENAAKNEYGKRTTKDLFGDCLHKYVITDAIRDENVLRFSVDYVGRYKAKDGVALDIEVEDIDRSEVYKDPVRMERIADHIIATHDRKTHSRAYSALFATSGIDELVKYYDIFWKKKMAGQHDLRIAAIYTYGTNEDDVEAVGALPEETLAMAAEPAGPFAASHSRDKLETIVSHYNAQYRTAYNTKDQGSLENYFKDISKKLKDREKVSD